MDTTERKERLKKLNAQATQAKMDLHDLSEELPRDWGKIPEVADRAYKAYQALIAAKQETV